jgi:hypothetical protein
MRRSLIIGLVALGLTATAVHVPAYQRICSSAQNFRHYFKDLKSAGSSLSPIERFVFSLVLANTKSTSECPAEAVAPPPNRT